MRQLHTHLRFLSNNSIQTQSGHVTLCVCVRRRIHPRILKKCSCSFLQGGQEGYVFLFFFFFFFSFFTLPLLCMSCYPIRGEQVVDSPEVCSSRGLFPPTGGDTVTDCRMSPLSLSLSAAPPFFLFFFYLLSPPAFDLRGWKRKKKKKKKIHHISE